MIIFFNFQLFKNNIYQARKWTLKGKAFTKVQMCYYDQVLKNFVSFFVSFNDRFKQSNNLNYFIINI